MVHFLQQGTKHLTVKILGFLIVHVADVTEHWKGIFTREREICNFNAYIYPGFKI